MSETGQVNRLFISLLALVVIFVALLAVLLAWGAPEGSIERVSGFAEFLERHNDREGQLILTLAASVVILVMTSILILELTASPAQRMRVRNVTSGEVTITTARIAEHIDDAVRSLPHIAGSEVKVDRQGKRVNVVLDLHVDAGADLAMAADAACRTAHTLVEKLGIELATMPRARLHYRELRLHADTRPRADESTPRRDDIGEAEGQGAT
jgi:hypothetical protein